jgi:hypothetical protein
MVPAKILLNHTKLAHVVEYKLGTQSLIRPLYEDPNWHEWKSFDTINLLINHRAKWLKIRQFKKLTKQIYGITIELMNEWLGLY